MTVQLSVSSKAHIPDKNYYNPFFMGFIDFKMILLETVESAPFLSLAVSLLGFSNKGQIACSNVVF